MSFRHIFYSAILLGALAPAVGAADNLQITVNVTIKTLTLEWADTPGNSAGRDWVLNAVWNGTYDTNTHGSSTGVGALSGALTRFNVTNESDAPVDITRTIADGTWALAATNTAINTCILANSVDGAAYSGALTTAGAVIRTAMADAATMTYDLRITTPTAASGSSVTSGNIIVTLTATISP